MTSLVVKPSRPEYLRACLESILDQTVPPTEVVVSDDGNDPETAVYVSSLGLRYVGNPSPYGHGGNRKRSPLVSIAHQEGKVRRG